MPGLIHEYQYEADKGALCAECAALVDVFSAVEWALLRADLATLPLYASAAHRSARAFVMPGSALAPQIVVMLGEEFADGEMKIVLLAAARTPDQ